MFDRVAIVDAYVAYSMIYSDYEIRKRLEDGRAESIANLTTHNFYIRYDPNFKWDTINLLNEAGLNAFFSLVEKLNSKQASDTLRDQWDRIDRPNGVVIFVQNSDDDPLQINFYIADEIASVWADRHGSLCGGTWEGVDGGSEFVYDIGFWYPGLWEELDKEGYDLDFSEWGDPDEEDIEVGKHIRSCEECQYDGNFSDAKRHWEEKKDK